MDIPIKKFRFLEKLDIYQRIRKNLASRMYTLDLWKYMRIILEWSYSGGHQYKNNFLLINEPELKNIYRKRGVPIDNKMGMDELKKAISNLFFEQMVDISLESHGSSEFLSAENDKYTGQTDIKSFRATPKGIEYGEVLWEVEEENNTKRFWNILIYEEAQFFGQYVIIAIIIVGLVSLYKSVGVTMSTPFLSNIWTIVDGWIIFLLNVILALLVALKSAGLSVQFYKD